MLLVYMTAPSPEEAQTIASSMVEQRLAACANILPGVSSIYHWKGKVERAQETICIFKTTDDGFEALSAAILEQHSYETPCVVALPVSHSTEAFAQWLTCELAPGHLNNSAKNS